MFDTTRLALAASLLLAACGGGGGGDPTGCDFSALGGVCAEYHYADAPESFWRELRTSCESNGGAWQPCPAADRAGTCDIHVSDRSYTRFVYYAGYVCSAEEGRARCDATADGFYPTTFTPGPATCGAPTDQTLYCDAPTTLHACAAVTGAMSPERLESYRLACAHTGAVVQTPCPTAGALATCTETAPGGEVSTVTYYSGADLAAAEASCADGGGTWAVPE